MLRREFRNTILLSVALTAMGLWAAVPVSWAAEASLTGAGASFPYPLYSKWFDVYEKATGVRINYQSIGSGGGIRQIQAGTVDFGASDAPLTDDEAKKMPGPVLHIPTVAGAVVVAYNLLGVSERLHQPGCLVVRIETLDGSWADSVYGWSIRLDYECGSFRTIPEAEIVALPAEAIDRLGEAMADHIRYESAFAGLESIAERDYGAYTWSDEDSWSVDAGSGATLEDLGITGVERIDYAIEKIDETLEEVNRHDAD